MQNFSSSRSKFRYGYLLTSAGLVQKSRLTTEFLRRKVAKYYALQLEIEALRFKILCDTEVAIELTKDLKSLEITQGG